MRHPAPPGPGGEDADEERRRVRVCRGSHGVEREAGGPGESPAEKDTDNSANTFNALRIHGRKKTFSDSQKYYKKSRAGETHPALQ